MRFPKVLLILMLLCSYRVHAQPYFPRPKLVVTIVIDQMRQDYLTRYWDLYSEDGFKKVVNNGFNFANSHFSYYPTYTAAGHANVSTGATPAMHGIVGNDWYDNKTGEKVYCTSDRSVKGVGTESSAGQMSPVHLKSTTLGDELKLATNQQSRVFGVALKDRGAILCAGHSADAAYWYDSGEGKFVSSSYYMNDLPKWVNEFNKKKLWDKYTDQTWLPIKKIEILGKVSDTDNSPFENKFDGKDNTAFPYPLRELKKKSGPELIATTPWGNTMTFDFAKALIKAENLGKKEYTDALYVSLSSTDYIGHFFGPRAVEVADTYLRLDLDLADFIRTLEDQVGKDNFILVITADHGAADNPGYYQSKKLPGGNFDGNIVKVSLREHLEKAFGKDLIDGFKNMQIYLNHEEIAASGLNIATVNDTIISFLKFQPGIQRVFPASILAGGGITDEILLKYQRGYTPDRCGDIYIQLLPGWIDMNWSDFGTTHGSPYSYDTHAPMLFYGKNIPKGFTYDRTAISQIAPTVAALLGITPPNGTVEAPLIRYFR